MDRQVPSDDTAGQRYDKFAQELEEAGNDVESISQAFSRYPDLFSEPSAEGFEDTFSQQLPISVLAMSTTMILLDWEMLRHDLAPSMSTPSSPRVDEVRHVILPPNPTDDRHQYHMPFAKSHSTSAVLSQPHISTMATAPSIDIGAPIPSSAAPRPDNRKRGRSPTDYIGDMRQVRDKRVRFESEPDEWIKSGMTFNLRLALNIIDGLAKTCVNSGHPDEPAFEVDLPVSFDNSPTVNFEQFADFNHPHSGPLGGILDTDFGLSVTPGFPCYIAGGAKADTGSSTTSSTFGANGFDLLNVTPSSHPALIDQSQIGYQATKLIRGDKLRHHVPENIKLPANMKFTMAEICRFLPKIFNRPKVMERALLNGFDCWTLAELEMAAFDDYTFKDLDDANERFKQSKLRALKILHGTGSQKAAKLRGRQNDLSAKDWKLKSDYVPAAKYRTEEQHMYLWEIYRPVDKPPTDNDRGEFTACLELWKENEDACPDLTTEDLEWLLETVKDLGIMPGLALNGYANHDAETLARFGKKSKKTASTLAPKKEKEKE